MGAKGLGGFTAISSEDAGMTRGNMPKSASTSHLSGLQSGTTSQAVSGYLCLPVQPRTSPHSLKYVLRLANLASCDMSGFHRRRSCCSWPHLCLVASLLLGPSNLQ